MDESKTEIKTTSRLNAIIALPVVIFLFASFLLALTGFGAQKSFEPRGLLPLLNGIFLFACPMMVVYVAGRGYLASGSVSMLMLWSGVFSFALGSLIAGFLLPDKGPNAVVTIHNCSMLLAGLLHLMGVLATITGLLPEQDVQRRRRNLVLPFLGISIIMATLTYGVSQDMLPLFFIQGQGPTLLRQLILGAASLSFLISGILFLKLYNHTRSRFLYWYAMALLLIFIGLCCIFVQESFGSPIGWMGRSAQYLAGFYLLMGVFRGAGEFNSDIKVMANVLYRLFQSQFELLLEERTAQLTSANEQLRVEMERRKQSEELLTLSKQQLELAYRSAGAGTWDWDMVCQRLDWSRELYTLFGLDPDGAEATFDTWNRVLHPDDREKARNRIDAAIKEKIPLTNEYRVILPEGQVRWIGSLGDTTYDSSGQPVRMAGICTDITERKRVEEALRESEEKHRILLEESSDPIFSFTPEGQYKYVNRAFAEGIGKTVGEIMGKRIWDVFPREEADKRLASLSQVFRTGAKKDIEVRVPRADGDRYYVTTITPIKDAAGEVVSAICSSKDITERRKAEEEGRVLEERLQRAEKMEALGTLAGGVAHDLNNVLGIVVGYAGMLLDAVDETSPIRSDLQNILNGGERAAAIVQDLLTLARRGVSNRKVLNLSRMVADYRNSPEFKMLSSYHPSVQIKIDLEPNTLNISGSSVHIGKTLFNLVLNGCEAMPNGGVLTIRTTNQYIDKPVQGYDAVREGDYVALSVSDSGEGIPADDLKRIFEPFYTKKVMGRSGTGLGLAVVWGTVKDHNGYINVQSEENKGSTFTLYFPVTREEITADQADVTVSEYMGRGESILIVDDVKGQRDLAAAMLGKLNYSIASVSSGEDAVAYLKEHQVDLMVLDMIMDPGMDGLDTYKQIIEIRPKQKAIIVSGFSESDRVTAAQALGAGAYMKKPYIPVKMGLAVRKELDRSA